MRSLNKYSFVVRGAYYPLCSCRGPVLAELGHPDVAAEDICTSACIGIRGALRSRRGCGRCAVVQCVRPVPGELGRGRAVACLVCCLMTGCFVWGYGERPCDTLRALPENAARYRRAAPAPLYVLWFSGSRNPAGVAVDSRWFCVRPVPSELGRGRAVAVWSVAWWLDVLHVGRGLSPFGLLRDG